MLIRLLRIELIKLLNYRPFWIQAGLLLVILIFFSLTSSRLGALFQIGDLTKGIDYVFFVGRFFIIIPVFIIVNSISNEYSFLTGRQSLIDGWSRNEFFLAKALLIVFLSILLSLILLISILYLTFSMDGLELTQTSFIHLASTFSLFVIQCVGILFFSMLVTILLKKNSPSLGVIFIYGIAIEAFLRFYFLDRAPLWSHHLFPVNSFLSLIKLFANI